MIPLIWPNPDPSSRVHHPYSSLKYVQCAIIIGSTVFLFNFSTCSSNEIQTDDSQKPVFIGTILHVVWQVILHQNSCSTCCILYYIIVSIISCRVFVSINGCGVWTARGKNTEPTFCIFGILSSVFSVLPYCKYRRRYRYRHLKISHIGSVIRYTVPTWNFP